MAANEIRANLTVEQWAKYQEAKGYDYAKDDLVILEALAERNRLLKKHHWNERECVDVKDDYWIHKCVECDGEFPNDKPNCAIAAALKGVGE